MIIPVASAVALLALLAGTAAEGLLGFLDADVVDQQGAVVGEVLLLQLGVLGVVEDGARDGGARRGGLAVDAAAGDGDLDVQLLRLLAGDEDGLLHLHAGEPGLPDVDGHLVDADLAAALDRGGAGDGGLALAGGVDAFLRHLRPPSSCRGGRWGGRATWRARRP